MKTYHMTAPATLFDTCPLPGCHQPVDDPREPCATCRAAFGDYLRPPAETAVRPDAAEYRAELADRDAAVRAAITRQTAEPGWRRNQTCWLCEERRTCRPDPAQPARWICRLCNEGNPS